MGPREKLRAALDARLGRASTLVTCVVVYAVAFAAAVLAGQALSGQGVAFQALAGTLAATLMIYIAATAIGNASLYDPYWSVAPPILLALALAQSEASMAARHWIVLALVLGWALRLTWNCLDRWPQLVAEDFRYRDLRAQTGRMFWLVGLTGIMLFPTLLVYLGCLPLFALAQTSAPLGLLDALALALGLFAIAIEALADWQLRHHKRGAGGILTRGVWGLSQHPNYLGEVSFWWSLALFGLAAGGPFWTISGALAMTGLFRFISIPMMLKRKRARHPGYDDAVRGIPVLLPRPW